MNRIQRRRGVKGWRMPEGAKYVGRGSRWGNPYTVAEYGREGAVQLFREHLESMTPNERATYLEPLKTVTTLCCWCKPGELCHADVLIEYLETDNDDRRGGATAQ